MNIISVAKKMYHFYLNILKPLNYAQKIGVKMGSNIRIYGKIYWGSEPWLITLGNNV